MLLAALTWLFDPEGPIVRQDLPEIVHEFARRGMHVRIQTNGLAGEERLVRDADPAEVGEESASVQRKGGRKP